MRILGGFIAIFLLFTACLEEELFNPVFVDLTPVEGDWEITKIGSGSIDSVKNFYNFNEDYSFEYYVRHYSDGSVEVSEHQGGRYSVPTGHLLILNHEYRVVNGSRDYSVQESDTLIYKYKLFDELILCDLAKSFHQLSGEANSIANSTFVHSEPYFTSYFHNRYSFTEDSLYLYSVFTQTPQLPEDWSTPFKFEYQLEIPELTLTMNRMPATPITLVQHSPGLIITYNERVFVKSRAQR